MTRHPPTSDKAVGAFRATKGPDVALKIATSPSSSLNPCDKFRIVSKIVPIKPMIGNMSHPPIPDGPGEILPSARLLIELTLLIAKTWMHQCDTSSRPRKTVRRHIPDNP